MARVWVRSSVAALPLQPSYLSCMFFATCMMHPCFSKMERARNVRQNLAKYLKPLVSVLDSSAIIGTNFGRKRRDCRHTIARELLHDGGSIVYDGAAMPLAMLLWRGNERTVAERPELQTRLDRQGNKAEFFTFLKPDYLLL